MDALEREIRKNVLLKLIAELYQKNLSDAISVKEWLESKLDEPAEGQPRCTNSYLCPNDSTRWDAKWSCMCDDRCATCGTVTEPYATTDKTEQRETIHNQEVYDRAIGLRLSCDQAPLLNPVSGIHPKIHSHFIRTV